MGGRWEGVEAESLTHSSIVTNRFVTVDHNHERENRELETIIYHVMDTLESVISRLELVK